MSELLFEKESFRIRGALYQVYTEMGCGFLEAVYQECLEKEFMLSEIPFKSQSMIILKYKGAILERKYYPDFLCFDKIIIEIKAVKKLEDIHTAQVINYLKATGLKLGLLVNFNHFPKVDIRRIVL